MINCVAVIVTHNSEQLIQKLLSSLLKQTVQLHKVIIVDNDSNDNTLQICQSFNSDMIEIIYSESNLGGSGGFKIGLEKAVETGADYIVTFDDDALPLKDNCLALLLNSAHDNGYDVVSPLVVSNENRNITAYKYKTNNIRLNEVKAIQELDEAIIDIKLFNGVMFNRKVIDACGFPNPDFFIRGDEEDYKQRILSKKFKVKVDTRALVLHPLSSNEYIEWKGRRFHYISHIGKRYFTMRNRIYLLTRNNKNSQLSKLRIIVREFYEYFHFYMSYRHFDFLGFKVWMHAFIDGLRGDFKNKRAEFYKSYFTK